MQCRLSLQGDHWYGKPGNVRDFDSCQLIVSDFLLKVREMSGGGNLGLKLFIVGCIFASIFDC